jgi:hypothetical protein
VKLIAVGMNEAVEFMVRGLPEMANDRPRPVRE